MTGSSLRDTCNYCTQRAVQIYSIHRKFISFSLDTFTLQLLSHLWICWPQILHVPWNIKKRTHWIHCTPFKTSSVPCSAVWLPNFWFVRETFYNATETDNTHLMLPPPGWAGWRRNERPPLPNPQTEIDQPWRWIGEIGINRFTLPLTPPANSGPSGTESNTSLVPGVGEAWISSKLWWKSHWSERSNWWARPWAGRWWWGQHHKARGGMCFWNLPSQKLDSSLPSSATSNWTSWMKYLLPKYFEV